MKWFIILSGIIVLYGTGQSEAFTKSEAWEKTEFWLYTNANKDGQVIQPTEESFAASTFNASWPVRFYTHGFGNNNASEDCILVTKAYLQKDNYNVFVMNWGKLSGSAAASWEYPIVADSIPYLGMILAEFSVFMNKTMKVSFDDMYLIGHDLGGQICGYAGQNVSSDYSYKYNTIFALDPAGPSFESNADEDVVDKSDASYVELIQTDTVYGMTRSTGHAAFLANFGSSQPGCFTDICSHSRAYQLFAKSINSPTPFLGKRCTSNAEIRSGDCTYSQRVFAPMGGEPSTPKEGVYYLPTTAAPPYTVKFPDSAEIQTSTEIKLYTAASNNGRTVSVSDKTSLTTAGFKAAVPTRILICDYRNFDVIYATSICQRIKNAYLARGEFNVFIYDWQNLSSSYKKTLFADDISEPVAKLFNMLTSDFGVDSDKMVAVGSNLGAKIAAFASKGLAPGKLGTLFALESRDNILHDGVTYIESIKSSSSNHNGDVTIHVGYLVDISTCLAVCQNDQIVNIFVKSLAANSQLTATKCEEYKESILPLSRCLNPGPPAKVGGEPPVRKPNGEYYMQISILPPLLK